MHAVVQFDERANVVADVHVAAAVDDKAFEIATASPDSADCISFRLDVVGCRESLRDVEGCYRLRLRCSLVFSARLATRSRTVALSWRRCFLTKLAHARIADVVNAAAWSSFFREMWTCALTV